MARRWKIAVGFGALLGVIAAVLFGQPYRGKWALERWIKARTSEGEKFAVADFAPRAGSAADNGFDDLIAAVRQVYAGNDLAYVAPPSFRFVAPGKVIALRDLTEWEASVRQNSGAKVVTWPLLDLEVAKNAEPLGEIRTALAKPKCRASLDYHNLFNLRVPHLATIKGVPVRLSVAVENDLGKRDLDGALTNLYATVASLDTLKDEPLPISQLVRLSMFHLAFPRTWQALQVPGWTDEQLSGLQRAWQPLEFILPMEKSFLMQRARTLEMVPHMRASSEIFTKAAGIETEGTAAAVPNATPPLPAINQVSDLVRHGEWLFRETARALKLRYGKLKLSYGKLRWRRYSSYSDALRALKISQAMVEGLRQFQKIHSLREVQAKFTQNLKNAGVAFDSGQKSIEKPVVRERRLRQPLTEMMNGLWHQSIKRVAVSEVVREMTVTAIALERYRLKHGNYPASLAGLVSEFLPRMAIDFMDGQPLRYRTVEPGKFVLYSVGEDFQDDQGDASHPSGSMHSTSWLSARDLVWPQPASPEEVAANEAKLKSRAGFGRLDPQLARVFAAVRRVRGTKTAWPDWRLYRRFTNPTIFRH